jgi:hypothetical protein
MPVAKVCARESVAHKDAGAAVVSLGDDDEHAAATKSAGRTNANRMGCMMNLSTGCATRLREPLPRDYVRPRSWYPTLRRTGKIAAPVRGESMKPRYFVPFGSLFLFVAIATFEACSSSSSNGGAVATDADASGGDTGSAPTGPVQCGAPPFVNLGIVVQAAGTADAGVRIGGAVLTSPLCPDASFTSDDDGGIVGLVSQNVPFYGRFNAPGYAPTLSPQEEFATDSPPVTIALPPSLLTVIVPNYDKTKPLILIDARLDTGTNHDGGANCNDVSGVSFSVDGHPEAQITYYTGGAVPSAISGGTATDNGLASIGGLDVSSSPVTITAAKTGCTISFQKNGSTGKIPLEDAYISIAGAYLRN